MERLPRLSTEQAASRLGVKKATLYAYVARGRVSSSRDESGGSSFDPLEIEGLAAARRPGGRGPTSSGGRMAGRPLMVLDWDRTLLADDRLYFRGVPARELADRFAFEQAVAFFWTGVAEAERAPWSAPLELVEQAERAGAALGATTSVVDRLSAMVTVVGSHDPNRRDLTPAAVFTAARRTMAALTDALRVRALRSPALIEPTEPGLAARLWPAIGGAPPSAAGVGLLNAALVLCIDHDLAPSTMAARVAASARADPYSSITAALSALSGTLHGAVSATAWTLIRETMQSGRPEWALARQVAAGHGTPGFGHPIYVAEDPRAAHLLDRMRSLPTHRAVADAVDRLSAVVRARLGRPPNLDLALAAMVVGLGGPPEAAQAVFAIGRIAGWSAHILDEYSREPLRLRPESRYVGPPPQAPRRENASSR